MTDVTVRDLRPVSESGTPANVLIARWAKMPVLDIQALRDDIDSVLD